MTSEGVFLSPQELGQQTPYSFTAASTCSVEERTKLPHLEYYDADANMWTLLDAPGGLVQLLDGGRLALDTRRWYNDAMLRTRLHGRPLRLWIACGPFDTAGCLVFAINAESGDAPQSSPLTAPCSDPPQNATPAANQSPLPPDASPSDGSKRGTPRLAVLVFGLSGILCLIAALIVIFWYLPHKRRKQREAQRDAFSHDMEYRSSDKHRSARHPSQAALLSETSAPDALSSSFHGSTLVGSAINRDEIRWQNRNERALLLHTTLHINPLAFTSHHQTMSWPAWSVRRGAMTILVTRPHVRAPLMNSLHTKMAPATRWRCRRPTQLYSEDMS
jgi:hypothetical protein